MDASKLDYYYTPNGLLYASLGDYRARTTTDRRYHITVVGKSPMLEIWTEVTTGSLDGNDSSTDLNDIQKLLENYHHGHIDFDNT
jgi:hypothetical protein